MVVAVARFAFGLFCILCGGEFHVAFIIFVVLLAATWTTGATAKVTLSALWTHSTGV